MRRFVASLILAAGRLFGQAAPVPQTDAATGHPYTMLYVFGDSYSDTGAGYVDGNGPTAVAYMAQHLGISFTFYGDPKSTGKGLNFAVSGASSGEGAGFRYPTGPMLGFGMANQVEHFVRFYRMGVIPKFDPATTMFFFAGGLNDGRRPVGFVRTSIEAEIDALYSLGARRFTVALLPTKIPGFGVTGRKFNPELATVPGEMRARHPDIRIANSDWGLFFDEVLTHPAKYGITDTANACAKRSFTGEPVEVCANPDAHFYFHEAHPSTATHRAVGEMLYREAITKAP